MTATNRNGDLSKPAVVKIGGTAGIDTITGVAGCLGGGSDSGSGGGDASVGSSSRRIRLSDGKTGETLVNRSESAEHIPAAFSTEGEC
jgi:hypothetical protein